MTTGLELRDVHKHFGGIAACDGISISLAEGSAHAIIGPNGAGKTTLFKIIIGVLSPDSGDVLLDGRALTGKSTDTIVGRGIGVTFQITRFFEDLSAVDNVVVSILAREGRYRQMWRNVSRLASVTDEAQQLLGEVGLSHRRSVLGSELSHGERKALEIGVAMAGRPRWLLLDEPTAGMSYAERQDTVDLLERLHAEANVSVLFTEHSMDVVMRFAEKISVMARGRIIAGGTPEEVSDNPLVREAYLGRKK